MNSRTGMINVPCYRGGEFRFGENDRPLRVGVSNRSPSMRVRGQHFTTISKKQQEVVLRYLDSKDIPMGVSREKRVGPHYTLKEGEKWIGTKKHRKDTGLWQVEVIEEPGACNDYRYRDKANIHYYLDLEAAMPGWPWPLSMEIRRKFLNNCGLF
jgi:hypothetical protein